MTDKSKVKNIFIMPAGASKTHKHFKDTILKPVKQSVIKSKVSSETMKELKQVFGDREIAVWGSVDGPNNRIFFKKMKPGDSIVFSVGKSVKVVGEIAVKTISPELSQVLWASDRTFSLIYFINMLYLVDVPVSGLFSALGYKEQYIIQGLTSVSQERLNGFYKKYKSIDALVKSK